MHFLMTRCLHLTGQLDAGILMTRTASIGTLTLLENHAAYVEASANKVKELYISTLS